MNGKTQHELKGVIEKEVRQQDIIALKSTLLIKVDANNLLVHENTRLKTRNAQLEKEIERLEKGDEEGQAGKGKPKPRSDLQSLRTALRNKDRELEELRKENTKVKTSVKFTTIN